MTTELIQGTDDWIFARLGKVTASRIKDVVAKAKTGNGWGESRRTYRKNLAVERIKGKPRSGMYKSEILDRGNDTEPQARDAYIRATFNEVTEVGFVPHPHIDMSGASPDGLVAPDGIIQIKCPLDDAHYETLKNDKIDGGYIKQIQWELACTERKWADYVSFNPEWPDGLQLKIIRVDRDDEMIAELEKQVIIFLKEVDKEVKEMKTAA